MLTQVIAWMRSFLVFTSYTELLLLEISKRFLFFGRCYMKQLLIYFTSKLLRMNFFLFFFLIPPRLLSAYLIKKSSLPVVREFFPSPLIFNTIPPGISKYKLTEGEVSLLIYPRPLIQ